MEWIKIVEWIPYQPKQLDTYPPEGVEVLVTDGTHYDVAWYLRSGEYRWVKTNVKNDALDDFLNFIPTHWSSIKQCSI